MYLAENPQINLNSTYFVEAVVIPIVLASGIFLGGRRWIIWFAFMAYIWSVTDDAPVYLDSVFTWPEVTSGFQHYFLEVLLHILTLFFMSLTIREAFRLQRQRRSTVEVVAQGDISSSDRSVLPKQNNNRKLLLMLSLFVVAFVSSYAQNLPLHFFQTISGTAWYRLDIVEHIVSIAFLFGTVKVAMKG